MKSGFRHIKKNKQHYVNNEVLESCLFAYFAVYGIQKYIKKKKKHTNTCFFSWRLEFSTQKYVGTFQLQRFQKQHTIIILCEHEK